MEMRNKSKRLQPDQRECRLVSTLYGDIAVYVNTNEIVNESF